MTTWLEKADQLLEGAERALAEGDMVAFSELISAAAGCVIVARNLERAEQASRGLSASPDQG